MTRLDLSPLFHTTVGFDRLMSMFDEALDASAKTSNYPPYNIVKKTEDKYQIVMAVAGFKKEDLAVTVQENDLKIMGKTRKEEDIEKKEYLYRGMATRSFERKFQLDDFIQIETVSLKDGLLYIDLHRVIPEEKKMKTIDIQDDTDKLLTTNASTQKK